MRLDRDTIERLSRQILGREIDPQVIDDSTGRYDTLLSWVRGLDQTKLATTSPAGLLNLAHAAWQMPGAAEPAYATVRPTGRGSGYGGPAETRDAAQPAGHQSPGALPDGEGPFLDLDPLGLERDGHELAFMSLVDAAAAVRSRDVSPVELTEAALARIAELNPELNAFVTVLADEARRAAREAEARLLNGAGLSGPLHGLPVALKDIIETAGVRTACGSRVLVDHIPAEDATVVRRLRDAGAVIVGKTNTHEFAFGPTTINPHWGNTRNPHNPARIAGGSSGGSAVAVATGQSYLALGTDTGGSVRIPAAACGVVGLKATYGRVSKAGVFPLSWSLDHVGPLTRTVADAALALTVLAGPDPADPSATAYAPEADWLAAARRVDDGLRGIRVGLPAGWDQHRVAPVVREGFRQIVDLAGSLGATVEEVPFPQADAMMLVNRLLILAEAAAYHLPNLRERPEQYGADVRARLELGQYIMAVDYLAGQRMRSELCRSVAEVMRRVDLILTPALPVPAPYIGQDGIAWPDGLETVPDAMIRFLAPFNVTGQPALSLPIAGEGGLPLAVQIAGRPFEEDLVLRAAAVLEAALLSRQQPPTGSNGKQQLRAVRPSP